MNMLVAKANLFLVMMKATDAMIIIPIATIITSRVMAIIPVLLIITELVRYVLPKSLRTNRRQKLHMKLNATQMV